MKVPKTLKKVPKTPAYDGTAGDDGDFFPLFSGEFVDPKVPSFWAPENGTFQDYCSTF
tara:strand:- start:209 stop:382 length:174 start_codon:yes stop_codon:yes gene_type:complete